MDKKREAVRVALNKRLVSLGFRRENHYFCLFCSFSRHLSFTPFMTAKFAKHQLLITKICQNNAVRLRQNYPQINYNYKRARMHSRFKTLKLWRSAVWSVLGSLSKNIDRKQLSFLSTLKNGLHSLQNWLVKQIHKNSIYERNSSVEIFQLLF